MSTSTEERDFLYTEIEDVHRYAESTEFTEISADRGVPEVKAKAAYTNATRQRFIALHHDIGKRKLDDAQRQEESVKLRNFLTMCSAIDMKLTEVLYRFQYQENTKSATHTNKASDNSTLKDVLETMLEKQSKNIMEIVSGHKEDIKIMATAIEKHPQSHQKRFKLPPLQIPQFSGKLTEWQQFHDLYECSIHKRDDLEPVEKFQYLKSLVTGEAASIIKNFAVTEANYNDAWDMLVSRYNKPKNIVFDCIKTYITQCRKQVNNPTDLRVLFVTLDEAVRALDALKASDRDPWLIHIAMEAFDPESRNQWSREPTMGDIPTWDEFKGFLEQRCDAWASCWDKKQEKPDTRSVKNNFGGKPQNPFTFKTFTAGYGSQQNPKTATTPSLAPESPATLVTTMGRGKQCFICYGLDHHIVNCQQFLNSQPSRRVELIKAANLCFNCLRPGHKLKDCRSGTCRQCKSKHNTLLHDAIDQKTGNRTVQSQDSTQASSQSTVQAQDIVSVSSSHVNTVNPLTMVAQGQKLNLLPSAQIIVTGRDGIQRQCRALLDSCSQSNMITRFLAEQLDLPLRTSSVGIVKGIGAIPAGKPQELTTDISSRDKAVSMKLDLLVLDHITDDQPVSTANVTHMIPSNVFLADPEFYKPGRIDVLLGADVFMKILRSRQIPGSPTFQETAFGFIAAGSYDSRGPMATSSTFILTCSCSGEELESLNEKFTKFVNAEELQNQERLLTDEEKKCEEHFTLNTTRDEMGRFVCGIPTRDDLHTLGESKQQALKQFLCGERQRLKNPKVFEAYKQFMQDYRESNHMRLQPPGYQSPKPEVFLPHHPVFKESSTTPLRVVFNASKKTSSGKSLNDVVMVGPKVQDDIFDIMIRCREDNYVIKADLKQMFRHIKIKEEDQSLLKIWWRDSPDEPLQIYLLSTVTYGTACAPFQAARCVKQLAIEGKEKWPLASVVAERDIYMDDVITSVSDVTIAKELKQQLDELFKSAGFLLRKWCSNAREVLEGIPEEDREIKSSLDMDFEGDVKTLGISWNPATDVFTFSTTQFDPKVTKRSMLSDMSRIFDPLGLLAPLTVTAKILLQSLWKLKVDWDTELDQNIQNQWEQYQRDVYSVTTQLTIPRQITAFPRVIKVQLIGFGDASEKAFSACVYVRTIDSQGNVCSRLCAAKTKVSPVKKITIARLELCAATLLAKLITRVKSAMKSSISEIHAFSDSTVTLCWIAADPGRWKTFVANRVSTIQSLLPTVQWHHVVSEENPADLASRGVPPGELTERDLWWHGPPWMTETQMTFRPAEDDHTEEELRKVVVLVSTLQNSFWDLINRFSSYRKIIRCIAYCQRFIHNIKAKKQKTVPISGQLTPTELNRAENVILTHVQKQMFPDDYDALIRGGFTSEQSRLRNLNPFMDNTGLMRVGGRIRHALIQFEQKHPILLPQNHRITELIVEEIHRDTLHGGTQLMLAQIRQKFWPIRGINLCNRAVRSCVICFRVKPKSTEHFMSDCHPARVTGVYTFYQTGIDYCGPVYIKTPVRSKVVLKMYIALFTCLSTRATHLELVTDLTTPAFIAALKRFIARRGKPKEIMCDNATTFQGADRELQEIMQLMTSEEHQTRVIDTAANEGITFRFIPPRSPHFGGSWESMVKRIKFHLYRTAGDSHLTQEEMLTVLAQIEACVNSRPLTPISSDPSDLEALTPGHFLIGRALTALPEQDLKDIPEGRLKRWKVDEQRVQYFWHRWSKEYLNTLQQRRKWTKQHPPIAIGDIVILKEDNLPPLKWKLGRVIEVHPGPDGIIRVATVQTETGTYRRGVVKLCILPKDNVPETSVSARPGNGADSAT